MRQNGGAHGVAAVPRLKADDLEQFRRRRLLVEQAALKLTMLQEGYRVWAAQIRARYDLSGPFDVNPQTGEIVAKEAPRG